MEIEQGALVAIEAALGIDRLQQCGIEDEVDVRQAGRSDRAPAHDQNRLLAVEQEVARMNAVADLEINALARGGLPPLGNVHARAEA